MIENNKVIARGVVFVQDEDGNNYYIPKDKLDEWNDYVDVEYFTNSGGDTPSWATLVEGEMFVFDILERLC